MFFIMFFVSGCGTSNKNNSVIEKKLIMPAYFRDTNSWEKVKESSLKGMIIVNPHDGPGDSVSSLYSNIINDIADKNPIGYVYTSYSKRDIEDVKADIDKWIEMYNIKGFFFDEVNNNYDYYKEISDYVKNKGNYKIVLNPGGTRVDESFYSFADLVIVYEDDYKDFDNNECKGNSNKKGVILYNADEKTFLDNYKRIDCEYIYFTDANPYYESLPTYFTKEVEVSNK